MVSSLSVYYRKLAYHVIESDGFLWVGFKPGMVHFIAKEVWNIRPLTRTDVERYYEEFTVLTQGKGSLYFRIVAHGGFLKEALVYELHGLTVSDDNYLRSLNSGRHVELYPHNEKAYRAIIRGFEQHRIGTVVQATGTGKSYLLARYISDHATERICVFAPNVTILEEIKKAERYIFIEFFIIATGKMWDPMLELLRQKAAAGVDVRVVYDDFGCITRLPMGYAKKLREMGIRAHAFNPYIPILSARLNNRDHRKLLIIDGKAAFTGGVNLADEYINEYKRFGHWKDCGILVRGKAVWSMTVMFLSLWGYVDRSEEDVSRFRADYPEKRGGTGFLQPFADSPLDNEDVGATILQSVISSAQERMWIMTPYLILDDKMTTALCVAAKTGVDVRIITPGIPDKWYVHAVTRANYEELTRAGVRIFEYTPGFIHSKVYLADTKQTVVGTVNLDFRSLYLHFEDAVYLYDTAVSAQVQTDFEETFPQCTELSLIHI